MNQPELEQRLLAIEQLVEALVERSAVQTRENEVSREAMTLILDEQVKQKAELQVLREEVLSLRLQVGD